MWYLIPSHNVLQVGEVEHQLWPAGQDQREALAYLYNLPKRTARRAREIPVGSRPIEV